MRRLDCCYLQSAFKAFSARGNFSKHLCITNYILTIFKSVLLRLFLLHVIRIPISREDYSKSTYVLKTNDFCLGSHTKFYKNQDNVRTKIHLIRIVEITQCFSRKGFMKLTFSLLRQSCQNLFIYMRVIYIRKSRNLSD